MGDNLIKTSTCPTEKAGLKILSQSQVDILLLLYTVLFLSKISYGRCILILFCSQFLPDFLYPPNFLFSLKNLTKQKSKHKEKTNKTKKTPNK